MFLSIDEWTSLINSLGGVENASVKMEKRFLSRGEVDAVVVFNPTGQPSCASLVSEYTDHRDHDHQFT